MGADPETIKRRWSFRTLWEAHVFLRGKQMALPEAPKKNPGR